MKLGKYQRSRSFFDLGLVKGHSDDEVKSVFLKNSLAIWNQSSYESLREKRNENIYN